jgi:hypothetical protein
VPVGAHMSVLDTAIVAFLRSAPARAAPEEAPSVVFSRAAALATQLSVAAAFRERLLSDDAAAIGCSDRGRLNAVGRRLSELDIQAYERAESRTETMIRATGQLHDTLLFWCFVSDETSACYTLRYSRLEDGTGASSCGSPEAPPPPADLVRVNARRSGGDETSLVSDVKVRLGACKALDRRHLGTGLDPAGLMHTLVGLMPEMLAPDWYEAVYEKVVDALLRRERRMRSHAMRNARGSRRRWLLRHEWCWWRRR